MGCASRSLVVIVTLTIAKAVLLAPCTSAAEFVLVNIDGPGVGLNDTTPATPVAGNPGTTLGEQRVNAFEAALERWGGVISSPVPILVQASMPDLFCDPNSALLGQASVANIFRDFSAAPRSSTWYAVALANALSGFDLDPGNVDVLAQFNARLDTASDCLGGGGWWYGIGSPAPPGSPDFFLTVLHEVAHGLGFSTFVDHNTGRRLLGFDDAYMLNLVDGNSGLPWPQLTDMQRMASATSEQLRWAGPAASDAASVLSEGVDGSGQVAVYSPFPLQLGSSVSHWDISVFPDELMEPFSVPGAADLVTSSLLTDLGYDTLTTPEPCVPGPSTLCLGAGDRFQVDVTWMDFEGGVGEGMAVPLSQTSGLLWFFSRSNLEMLIKVLDGCAINDRFWVFMAATTDVQFSAVVTDTATGVRRSYFNQLGQSADAITDTSAFATCSAASGSTSPFFMSSERSLSTAIDRELAEFQHDLVTLGDARLSGSPSRQGRSAVTLSSSRAGSSPRDALTSTPFIVFHTDITVDDSGEATQVLRLPANPLLALDLPLDRERKSSPSAGGVGPEGSTYSMRPLLAHPIDGGSRVFSIQEAGSNVVTFDDRTESLPRFAFGLGTQPRVKESATLLEDGSTLDIEVTILTRGGDDLFPGGITAGGIPLDDAAVTIGFLPGDDPLDFPHDRIVRGSVRLLRDNRTVQRFDLDTSQLPGEVWSGNLGVVFSGIAGQGIDAVRFEGRFELPSDGGGGNGDDELGEDLDPIDPFVCVPDDTSLCLGDGRFLVTLEWQDFEGSSGPGGVIEIEGSEDSGLLWFFSEDNIEMLVKVLDGCAFNDHFWVFFAATTDVAFDVTVRDALTGSGKRYSNPLGQPANAVTDTEALATCQ